jgi:hypothetical protein
MFGDDDINFDLQLEKWDVDSDALKEPQVLRIFDVDYECDLMLFGGKSFGSPLGLPKNIVTKEVYMRTSTSSGNDTFGARESMTKWRT